jgi:hypothetical protein
MMLYQKWLDQSDVPDFFPGTVDNLDDVYGGASKIEQYATKVKTT